MPLNVTIKQYTKKLEEQGLLRTRDLVTDGLIHFDSNDYLSLSKEKSISDAYQKGFSTYPSGSCGSMLLNGYHSNHQILERRLADWLEVDECVLFPSGYAANLAITSLLGQLQAHVFIDKGVHASIYDGLALAHVAYTRFLHNDVPDLEQKLAVETPDKALITEGLFSMSGQQAPLASIANLCKLNRVSLIVDEAHSIGVLGAEGRGAVDYYDLSQEQVPLRMLGFGKAFAGQGAVVAGQAHFIDALIQAGRSLIYTTAISPALTYGLLKTLDFVIEADDRRLKLQALIKLFNNCVAQSQFTWTKSDSQIQQLQLGCPHLALKYAQELRRLGFSCAAVRAPTVSAKASGLRVILNYQHEPDQIIKLFNALNRIHEYTSK